MNDNRRPWRYLWLLGVALLAGSAAGAGWLLNHSRAANDAAPESPGGSSTPGVICTGYVDVEDGLTSLYPVQPGQVTEVAVKEGEAVTKGKVLLRVDNRLALARVNEAKSDLEAAQAQLEQAEKLPKQHESKVAQMNAAIEAARNRLEAGRRKYEHAQWSVENKVLNAKEAEALAATVKELEAALKAEEDKLRELKVLNPELAVKQAKAKVAAAQAKVEQANLLVEEFELKAPADGTILRVQVNQGEVLSSQPKQAALLLCPDRPRVVRAEVLQEFAGRVKEGRTVTIADDAGGDAKWSGKVLRLSDWYTHRRVILPEPTQYNDVRTLECLVSINPGPKRPRIGQRMRVTIAPSDEPANEVKAVRKKK
jgi:multidrug resistance efflux pump